MRKIVGFNFLWFKYVYTNSPVSLWSYIESDIHIYWLYCFLIDIEMFNLYQNKRSIIFVVVVQDSPLHKAATIFTGLTLPASWLLVFLHRRMFEHARALTQVPSHSPKHLRQFFPNCMWPQRRATVQRPGRTRCVGSIYVSMGSHNPCWVHTFKHDCFNI